MSASPKRVSVQSGRYKRRVTSLRFGRKRAPCNGRTYAAFSFFRTLAAVFVLFTVLHDASHYSISSHRWVNVAFGCVAMFFVSPLISFKSFAFIHIEHHRNTNDGAADPDHFVSAAPWWQLPVRFPAKPGRGAPSG